MKKSLLAMLLMTGSLLADGAPTAKEGNLTQTLMMLGVGAFFFYFILFRPEQKRRKALEQQRSTLKKGDRATAMGILGIVVSIKDTSVILKMVDGSKIEVLKSVISDVQPGAEEEAKTVEVATVETSAEVKS